MQYYIHALHLRADLAGAGALRTTGRSRTEHTMISAYPALHVHQSLRITRVHGQELSAAHSIYSFSTRDDDEPAGIAKWQSPSDSHRHCVAGIRSHDVERLN